MQETLSYSSLLGRAQAINALDLYTTNIVEINECNALQHTFNFYKMTSNAYDNLLNLLIPSLRNRCVNQVRLQIEIDKILACVLHRFAYGHSAKHMVDCFKIGASIIRKYTCGYSL